MSWETLAGVAFALAFAGVAVRLPLPAAVGLTVLGAFRFFEAFVVAGNRISQGLFPIEVMATVCLGLGLLHRAARPGVSLVREIDRPFAAFLIVAVVSLAASRLQPDPAIDAAHVKLAVSIGQVLLIAWPLGIYQFVARALDSDARAERLLVVITVLAGPSLIVPVVPDAVRAMVNWSIYFGLAAGPFCLVRAFDTRSLAARLGLLAIVVAPAVNGLMTGKAFLYGFTTVTVVVVCFIRAPRLVLAASGLAIGLYLAVYLPASHSLLPGPLQRLVSVEQRQGSWGGASGRVQLALDTIDIWEHRPLLGVGPGNNWPYMNRYSVIDTPHNQYLNVLLETGVLGLGCFLLVLVGCLRVGWRLYRTATTPFRRMFAHGWLGYFAAMTLGSLTGDFVVHSIRNGGLELFTGFYIQWVMLGVLVGLWRLETSAEESLVTERAA